MMILLTSVRNSSSQMPLANHGENSDDPSTAALLPVEPNQPEHTRFNIVEHHLLPTHSVEFEHPFQMIESCAYICVKHPNCTTFSYNGFTGICSGADICVSYQLSWWLIGPWAKTEEKYTTVYTEGMYLYSDSVSSKSFANRWLVNMSSSSRCSFYL